MERWFVAESDSHDTEKVRLRKLEYGQVMSHNGHLDCCLKCPLFIIWEVNRNGSDFQNRKRKIQLSSRGDYYQ